MSTKCKWNKGHQQFYNTPQFVSGGVIEENEEFDSATEGVIFTETIYGKTFNDTGMHFRVTLAGTISSAASTNDGDITFRLRYGTTDILETIVTVSLPNEDDKAFRLVYEGRIHTIGASGKVVAVGHMMNEMTGMADIIKTTAAAGVSVDLTADGSINVTGQWDKAHADIDIFVTVGLLELFN